MRTGSLRKRVSYQTYLTSWKANGQENRQWTTAWTSWASVEPLSGREIQAAGHTTATLSHRITLRYRPDVHPQGRFSMGGRTFNIVSVVNEGERNTTLVVNALETVAGG